MRGFFDVFLRTHFSQEGFSTCSSNPCPRSSIYNMCYFSLKNMLFRPERSQAPFFLKITLFRSQHGRKRLFSGNKYPFQRCVLRPQHERRLLFFENVCCFVFLNNKKWCGMYFAMGPKGPFGPRGPYGQYFSVN